jgi:hypothetical protein
VNSPKSDAPPRTEAKPSTSNNTQVADHSHWDFEDVAGTRTPVLIALPKVGDWQVDDQKTTWWVATNSRLGMRLEAKLWPERRLVTLQDCITDLGRWRAVTGHSIDASAQQSRTVNVPAGFSSQLTVDLHEGDKSATRSGKAVLIGADVARCFAVWATVEAGTASDDEFLARMALLTEGILPKIRLRTVEQRVDGAEKVEH